MRKRFAAVLAVVTANLILFSCSSGPSAPQPGTPAFYWNAAQNTYAAGDYTKTVDNLQSLVAKDNEFTARAQPWLLVMTSGMAQGYMDLADSFEAGGRANKSNPTELRRQMNVFRGNANRLALQFAEAFGKFQTTKGDTVPLAFGYPTGNPNQVPLLAKVSTGAVPPGAEIEAAQKSVLQRSVILAACRAAGAPDDPAKLQEILKAPDANVARPVFVLAMAGALFDESAMYSRTKLDQPDKRKIFCTRAQEALKSVPDSKAAKDLNGKIESLMKKEKIS